MSSIVGVVADGCKILLSSTQTIAYRSKYF